MDRRTCRIGKFLKTMPTSELINNSRQTITNAFICRQCVTVKGIFDGFNYPREATDFKLYRKAFCRAFPFHFTHSGKFHGLAGNFYELDDFHAFNDDSTSNETKCFCNGQASCNMNGLGSISSCYYSKSVSIISSFPFKCHSLNQTFHLPCHRHTFTSQTKTLITSTEWRQTKQNIKQI